MIAYKMNTNWGLHFQLLPDISSCLSHTPQSQLAKAWPCYFLISLQSYLDSCVGFVLYCFGFFLFVCFGVFFGGGVDSIFYTGYLKPEALGLSLVSSLHPTFNASKNHIDSLSNIIVYPIFFPLSLRFAGFIVSSLETSTIVSSFFNFLRF